MLKCFIDEFQSYCHNLNLAQNSIKELLRYISQLENYLLIKECDKISQVQYKHLVDWVISKKAEPTTIKMRIWALKKFFSFLHLHDHIKVNIANELSPPKIPKRETSFLSEEELKIIFTCLAENCMSPNGLRNMIILLLMAVCALRKSSVVALNNEDFDAQNQRLWISEKGLPGKRAILIPLALSRLIGEYIYRSDIKKGPLFVNHKKQRLHPDGVNKIVNAIKEQLLNDDHDFARNLHPHILRHSAATQLNEIAGFTVSKEMLGHRNNQNTRKYIHLSPASYGTYMMQHPYFKGDLS
jgi:site-specific recombinase XerD